MGTDIHLVAEARDENDQWQLVPGPIIDCWACNGGGFVDRESCKHYNEDWLIEHLGEPCKWCNPAITWIYDEKSDDEQEIVDPFKNVCAGKVQDDWYSERNYDVFAILANVRNGIGFAGMKTGDEFTPISSDRGFPEDMSEDAQAWFKYRGGDHSDTWVDLKEILSYPFDKTVKKTGVVAVPEFRQYLKQGYPDNWFGDINGGSVLLTSFTSMKEYLDKTPDILDIWHPGEYFDGILPVCRIHWEQPISHYTHYFEDRMKMLMITAGEADCRLIMNFDS